jgi:uncharacterized protein YbjT (DUF2867 family)
MQIAIAGASGFVGTKLIEWLLTNTDHDIVALSRNQKASSNPRVRFVSCDLFSLLEAENALANCDIAYYLVHSMLPSAKLVQANFADIDLLLADNFARAAQKNKLNQIVYLGGIIPTNKNLSLHLDSRKEVEEVFKLKRFNYTILRAGLILGHAGSSFQILYKLITRLPLLICPNWTKNKMTPIFIDDAVMALGLSISSNDYFNQTYDIGPAHSLSYLDLMQLFAKKLQLKRIFISLPINFIKLSKLWIRLISSSPKELVYPLVDSLAHSMEINPLSIFKHAQFKPLATEQALSQILKPELMLSPQKPISSHQNDTKSVRSIQRMPMPQASDAISVAKEYMRWLPAFLRPILLVKIEDNQVDFCALSSRLVLLRLNFSEARSTQDRALFYITGGLLCTQNNKGRFEFRETMDKKFLITAIHDFHPSLPWPVYRFTQALVHAFVMYAFKKHLIKLGKNR